MTTLDPKPPRVAPAEKERPKHGFWKIDPETYDPLNEEFHFDFDPCPNPRPEDFDGLIVEWGKSNWVNPPFWGGVTAWVRKAIAEHRKGKTVVLILPLDKWVRVLIKEGAEIRVVPQHDWIHTETGKRQGTQRGDLLFILKPDGPPKTHEVR